VLKIRFYIDADTDLPHIYNHDIDGVKNESGIGEAKMTQNKNRFPVGWNEDRVRKVLLHYENQTEEAAVEEDESASDANTYAPVASMVESALDIQEPSTMWAVVRKGKIELLEKNELPEGARVLVTLLPDAMPNS